MIGLVHVGEDILVIVLLYVDLVVRHLHRRVLIHHLSHEAADLVEVANVVVGSHALRAVHDLRGVGAGLVLFDMSVEVGLLAKAALAQRALERLLLVVNIADVPLQIGRDGEGSLAVFTLVGLLPGMGAEVPSQVGRPREHLPTKFTRIPILRFSVAGGQHVLVAAQATEERQRGWKERRRGKLG